MKINTNNKTDKGVYNQLDVNEIEGKYSEMTSTVMIQNEDGTYYEGPPTVTLEDGTIVEVVFEINVVKVYDDKFNEPLNTPEDAFAYQGVLDGGRPDAASDGTSNDYMPSFSNSLENNFVRIEDSPKVSNFFTNQNVGMWSVDDILDENGNPTTGFAHELIWHGICGQPHIEGASTDPADYGGYLPIGIPKKGHGADGTGVIDQNMRVIFQWELEFISIPGMTADSAPYQEFNIGTNSSSLMYESTGVEVMNLNDSGGHTLWSNMDSNSGGNGQ